MIIDMIYVIVGDFKYIGTETRKIVCLIKNH